MIGYLSNRKLRRWGKRKNKLEKERKKKVSRTLTLLIKVTVIWDRKGTTIKT